MIINCVVITKDSYKNRLLTTSVIKGFFVMAGCDGRAKSGNYYTDFVEKLPRDTVILITGCAKYKYNKLDLDNLGEIPRVLYSEQCNDLYSF